MLRPATLPNRHVFNNCGIGIEDAPIMATGQKQESVEKQLAVTAPRKRKREETLTMKSRTFCIFGLTTMLVSSAWAQLANPVKASVPFAFAAGNTKLAAGEYTVKAIQHGVLKLEDASGKNAILLMVIPASRPATSAGPALIFHRYGRFYF